MKHIIKFTPGHDCIKFMCRFNSQRCHPNSGGSHGRHGLEMKFASIGNKGAVTFTLYTGWLPQSGKKDDIGFLDIDNWGTHLTPADLGYHSKTPRYFDQQRTAYKCEFCDNGPCYYDGSGLNATDAMYTLVNGGDEALWRFMDQYYEHVFNDAPYPKPTEYPKPLRS